MKKKLLIAALFIVVVLIVLAIYNTLSFQYSGANLKESIEETYFQPKVVAEIEKLNPESKTYPIDSNKVNGQELIENNSSWVLEFTDLTLVREDWHFKLYDYIKNKKPEKADAILKKYFEIKDQEITELASIEDTYKDKINKVLEENNGQKNTAYYKQYHQAVQDKKKAIYNVREKRRTDKINLFGRYYPALNKLNEDFNQKLDHRLSTEYNMKVEEIKHLKENSLKDGDQLIYLSL